MNKNHHMEEGDGMEDEEDEDGSSFFIIIGVSAAILVAATIAAIALVVHAKKSKIWCFSKNRSSKDRSNNKKQRYLEVPLQQADPNERPIIKAGPRPTESNL